MYSVTLDIYQTAALGAIILCLGHHLVFKSPTLRHYCIPAAVAGGIVFAVAMAAFHYSGTFEITFNDTLQKVFMMAFYSSVGFMASFRMLRAGGKLVMTMILLSLVLLTMQDVIGAMMASVFGYDPKLGLALGSISLTGGHGTAASYGPLLEEEYGLVGAYSVAVAAATVGLAVSGFIGGPLAKRRVVKHDLRPDETDMELSKEREQKKHIIDNNFLLALILMTLTVGGGTYICEAFKAVNITVPVYFGAMVLGLVIRNVCDSREMDLPLREIGSMGFISLAMFLSMALMSMKLWQIADLAGFMVVALVVQIVFVAIFAYSAIFRVTGKNYNSAALLTATCGFGLGATPNAMANMEALTKEYGPAPTAFFIIPLIGSVFIDLLNTGVLTVFLNVL